MRYHTTKSIVTNIIFMFCNIVQIDCMQDTSVYLTLNDKKPTTKEWEELQQMPENALKSLSFVNIKKWFSLPKLPECFKIL